MPENNTASPRQDLETTLSEQATQLRTAQRIARLGAYVLDVASGRWTSSEMLDDIFGIAADYDHSVDGWAALLHPDDRAAMQAYFAEHVVGRGQRFDREYRIVRLSDGAERWVHGCGELTLGPDGRPTHMIGTIQDCTERHQSEQALRAAHARLAEMFEGAHDAILLADASTGRILDANRAASRLLKRAKYEIIGLHQTDLHPPEVREFYRDRFVAQVEDATLVLQDTEVIDAQGHRIPVEIAASAVELPDGGRAIQGIFRDITQRKAAEAEILRREAHLTSVFRAVPVGISVVTDRTFLDVNPFMTQLTGYTAAELIGRSVRVLYPSDEEYDRIGQMAYTEIQDKGSCRIETTWRHKDGRLLEILLSAAQVVHEGRHVATTFAALDVTERRRLEAQLRQAQKMEAVGQLAGGVAHDFNNILTAMLLQLDYLREEPVLEGESREAVNDLLGQARRAADLTRQLLVFSRRQIMRKEPVDVNQVTTGVLRMLQRVLGENIEIRFRSAADAPWIEGDSGMLEQVLMNLCINARDAMPDGGRLEIATERVLLDARAAAAHAEARSGLFLKLTVTDTGTGIAEAILGRIFEPFFTTKEVGRGTGLGLSMVLGIVQQHLGWIDVQSTVGAGTTFSIHLPACATPDEGGIVHGESQATRRRGTETILVVEDESAVRRLLADLLRRLGYVVLEAANSQEALGLWDQHRTRIALVISDIVMPGSMSGLDLCEKLVGQNPGLRVIVLSGYNPDRVGNSPSRRANPFVHVAKPCDGAAIARIVGEMFEPRR